MKRSTAPNHIDIAWPINHHHWHTRWPITTYPTHHPNQTLPFTTKLVHIYTIHGNGSGTVQLQLVCVWENYSNHQNEPLIKFRAFYLHFSTWFLCYDSPRAGPRAQPLLYAQKLHSMSQCSDDMKTATCFRICVCVHVSMFICWCVHNTTGIHWHTHTHTH